jgi:hypothetical protein
VFFLTPRPRYTVAVNMRFEDRPVLNALVLIAQKEGCNITRIFRTALIEFVNRKNAQNSEAGQKLDDFLESSILPNKTYHQILTPAELKGLNEYELDRMAKLVRARKEELDSELRRRGNYFRW